MINTLKSKAGQYLESGNVLDDPKRLESLIHRLRARVIKSCDADETERLIQLLKDLEQHITCAS